MMNPILKKEMLLESRSIKFPLALMVYAIAMTAAAFLLMETAIGFSYNYVQYQSFTTGFPVLVFIQLFMVCLIAPMMTAGSISGERERQTLDIMLTTPVTPFSILLGKVLDAVCKLLLFLACSLPSLSICFIYGGIEWQAMVVSIFAIMMVGLFTGCIGIWCSCHFKRTIVSIIDTILLEILFFGAPIVILIADWIYQYNQIEQAGINADPNLGILPLVMLFNPLFGAADLIMKSCSSSRLAETVMVNGLGNSYATAGVMKYPAAAYTLLWFLITIALCLLFLYLGSRNLDAGRRRSRRRSEKSKKA